MNIQNTRNIILSHLKDYNPVRIGLFGSYARNEENSESDLDIMVKFKETLSLLQLIKLENELSKKLGVKVDLVTEGAIQNKIIKENINKNLKIIL